MDSVIVEQITPEEPSKVSIHLFDEREGMIVSHAVEVLSRQEANEQYKVMGEIVDGELILNKDDYYEEEDLDLFDESFEEFEDD